MKKVINSTKIFLKLFLYSSLSVVVFILITSKTGIIGGVRSFVVLTGSMQPAFDPGSIVLVQKSNTYGKRDVVAFVNAAGVTVTHRIVDLISKSDGLYYQMKGDANNTPDNELVPQKNVVGKKIFVIPQLGKLAQFLKTLPGFLGLIIIPSLLFIVHEVWLIKKEMEKEITKKVMEKMNTV